MRQPSSTELADFVRHHGVQLTARLLGLTPCAIYRRLNRAGVWVSGRDAS
jgi:hypothetical protein